MLTIHKYLYNFFLHKNPWPFTLINFSLTKQGINIFSCINIMPTVKNFQLMLKCQTITDKKRKIKIDNTLLLPKLIIALKIFLKIHIVILFHTMSKEKILHKLVTPQ